MDILLDATILALRLGNLFRSGDLSRLAWGLWEQDDIFS